MWVEGDGREVRLGHKEGVVLVEGDASGVTPKVGIVGGQSPILPLVPKPLLE